MEGDIEEKNKIEDNKKEPNIEELKKELEECEKLKEEYLAAWQRERADFLNYKKEELERFEEILKYAREGLILKILPILDTFEKAEAEVRSMKYEETKYKEVINGFLQIKTQLQDFLKSQEVEEIKTIGEKFDPHLHEVVGEVEVKDREPNVILEEIKKGYRINGRLLRPASVKVSK